MKILQIACIITTFLFLWPTETLAQGKTFNQFVNIVNPVRISSYTKDSKASLEAQYQQVKKRQLPATWLLTYDATLDSGIVSVAKNMNQFQELGIFLEVTEALAKDSDVIYNKTDSWHRANSIFLSGYTQADRIRLIDTSFEKFKGNFGYYPKSVGGWWVDSFSLGYMKEKYKITANLGVADQFSTDGYQVWGQYFGVPFYPSKFHAGIPARTLANKLDIATLQWAPRDPLDGYGRGPASLFSTQDYFTINLSDEYFKKLIDLYTRSQTNKFGQITVGLEGDLNPEAYDAQFSRQLDIILDLKKQNIVDIVTMKDFANFYKLNFPTVSPSQIIETDDLLGKKIKAIWYQSPALRVHLTYDYETSRTKILDLRFYFDNFQEPFYISPNRDIDLSINIPSIIDSAGNAEEAWVVTNEKLDHTKIENGDLFLSYKNGIWIKLSKEGLSFSGHINKIPQSLNKAPSVKVNKKDNIIEIFPAKSWIYPQDGLIFTDLTPQATNFLRQRKIIVAEVIILLTFLIPLFLVGKKNLRRIYRFSGVGIILVIILGGIYWYQSNSQHYLVSQAELDALTRLGSMPGGKVIVWDRVCLQCSFHTKFPPAVFANKRRYVATVSKKEVVYNLEVFTAKTREEARRSLDKLRADYIYVVKFEDYKEEVPFSPGDLNLEEIYSNANATIWRIKKN